MKRIEKRWDAFEGILFPSLKSLMAYKGSTYADSSDEHANYRVLAVWELTSSAAHAAFNRCVEKSFRLRKHIQSAHSKSDYTWLRKQLEDLVACYMIVWKEIHDLEEPETSPPTENDSRHD